jgi:glyoxylase-like metal-dependent hydrolase (beta-lactamase superfamily II)
MTEKLRVHTIVSPPFEENTYVVSIANRAEVIVIDPGFEPEAILDYLTASQSIVVAILNTHGHADHIAGNAAMKEAFPDAPLIIGAGDSPMLTDAELNLSAPFGLAIVSPPADRIVREGNRLEFAGLDFNVLEIPGHSPGHVVFIDQDEPAHVFGGDVLFRDSIGRTDFPRGSFEQLRDGIHQKLWSLADSTIVYPGHGPTTTIGREKNFNPFVGKNASISLND